MRLLIQKVKNLKIFKGNEMVLNLNNEPCFLIYIGIEKDDEKRDLKKLVTTLENLPLLNKEGKFLVSLKEAKPTLVFISNITLVANFDKNHLNFNKALEPGLAKNIFYEFVNLWQELGYNVYKTDFGSYLEVESKNLGPINFFIFY